MKTLLSRISPPTVAAVVSFALAVGGAQAMAGTDGKPAGCRGGDPLAGVHHPSRIEVVEGCIAVTGTVVWGRVFSDGDFKFFLRLGPADMHLLNDHNRRDQGGALVCEIVPADQPGCAAGEPVKVPLGFLQRIEEWFQGAYEFGTCSGANIAMPPTGARVRVAGPYVIDHGHGWSEIHPVWSLRILSPPPAP